MAFFYLGPKWFFGFDIALELLFGIVTALVAYYSFKVYRLCEQREVKLFAWAFTAISASYFIWPLINLLAFGYVQDGLSAIEAKDITISMLGGIYIHVILFVLGLSALAYFSFSIKDSKLYSLIASLSIIVIIFSNNAGLALNFVSAILLFYVVIYYYKAYKKNHSEKIVFVLSGFLMLFIARFVFVFAEINHLVYVLYHLTELFAYALIGVSMFKVIRKK